MSTTFWPPKCCVRHKFFRILFNLSIYGLMQIFVGSWFVPTAVTHSYQLYKPGFGQCAKKTPEKCSPINRFVFRLVLKIVKSDYWLRDVCPSVLPSLRMEQLGSHWTDFHEVLVSEYFSENSREKNQILKSDRNNSGTLHEDRYTCFTISRSVLLRMRNFSDKSNRKCKNTQFMFYNPFLKIVPFFR